MSFAYDVKAELCKVPINRSCCAVAEGCGVLLYASAFTANEVRIVTENDEFAARLPKLFQKAFSLRFDELPDKSKDGGKLVFRITQEDKLDTIWRALGYDRRAHFALHLNFALLEEECCRASFLRGAFLSGGSVTDPQKRYHLELATSHVQAGREVEALLSETPLLPGLDGRKMSKSYGNAINISMPAEETAKRIKKSQTDSERMITFDPENRPGVSGLLSTAAICTGRSEVEIADEIGMGGSGQLKKYVTEAVNEYFAPIRERRQRYENDLNYVKDVLHEGNRRANEIAEQTLAEVQDAMGMVY